MGYEDSEENIMAEYFSRNVEPSDSITLGIFLIYRIMQTD